MGPLLAAAARVLWHPTGIAGRHRPLYHRNLRDRGTTLEARVDGRIVVVTGASSGIGRATAQRLAAAGAEVVLVARSADRLHEVRDRIREAGGRAHVHPADLSDLDAIDDVAAGILAAHGHVDVLINNAGRSIRRSVAASADRFHDFERTLQLNYLGAIRLTIALLPSMRARRRGTIVNVSTAGRQLLGPRFAGYIASKAALDAFTDVLAAEVYADRIRCTSVLMPLVRTPMIAPTGRYRTLPSINADDAAAMICLAVVHRPRRVGTVLGDLAEWGDRLAPQLMLAGRSLSERRWSRDAGPPGDDALSRTASGRR